MSMTTLVILQFIKIFLVYTGITVVLPRVMFQSILKGRKFSERFLMSYIFGNFYIINIVFALQLLHISNLFTLTFVTGALSFYIWVKVNHIPLAEKLRTAGKFNRMLIQETMGTKQALYRFGLKIRFSLKRMIYYFYRRISSNAVEVFFFMLILYCLFWVYGRQMIISYGYHASDIPVHMSWINQLGRGNLFSAGVYPFGYHCMIYYLHIVFGIDTYTLIFRFAFVQVIYVHIVLFAALKLMCRSKYMPYAGTLVYILGGFFAYQTYFRYASALPQEYGMIFVIPSIYFLIRFFQTQKKRFKNERNKTDLTVFCHGIFIDTGNSFLWNDGRGSLLYWNCNRFLYKVCSERLLYKNYVNRNHQCISCGASNGDCACDRNSIARITWMGNESYESVIFERRFRK